MVPVEGDYGRARASTVGRRWTCKSTHALSAELFVRHGIRISHKTVAKLLRDHGYSLQAPNKSVEGAQHPDRNAQFEHINAKTSTTSRPMRSAKRSHTASMTWPPTKASSASASASTTTRRSLR